MPSSPQGSPEPSHSYGLQNKPGKIGSHSFSLIRLSGSILQHAVGYSAAYSNETSGTSCQPPQAFEQEDLHSQNDGFLVGNNGISRRDCLWAACLRGLSRELSQRDSSHTSMDGPMSSDWVLGLPMPSRCGWACYLSLIHI